MATKTKRRICRTPEECWEAGQEIGRKAPPLSQEQIDKLAPLWRIYLALPRENAA